MERLQRSMTAYVKTLSKRQEGDDKEKNLPVAYLGSTMVSHGEDFEEDSEFGQCLMSTLPLKKHCWHANSGQVWAEQTRELVEYRRSTLRTRLQAGLSRWRGLLLR